MKKIATLLVCLFGISAVQGQTCVIQFTMENSNRHVFGEVYEECPHIFHSSPWGNWGVSSNVGTKKDGHQFQGIHVSDRKYQWNSCTKGEYEAPNCDFYNHADCTEQYTRTGVNQYGGGRIYRRVSCDDWDPIAEEESGGCLDLDGRIYGPLDTNFMTLYELDARAPDSVVTTLYFDDSLVRSTLDCPDISGCNASMGPWVDSNSNDIASARIRVSVVSAYYYVDGIECSDE